MRRSAITPKTVFLVIALFTTACGSSPTSTEPVASEVPVSASTEEISEQDEQTSTLPSPAPIDITLEDGSASTVAIGPEGGSFEVADLNGTLYTLTIPEGALLSPEEITMTPIAMASGEAIGDTFVAGVSLEPQNLQFLDLITIEISGAAIESGALGFGAEEGGQDLHLTASETDGSSITIMATHFSEYGAAEGNLAVLANKYAPAIAQLKAEAELAFADEDKAIEVFDWWIDWVRDQGDIDTYQEWAQWTAEVAPLMLQYADKVDLFGWKEGHAKSAGIRQKMEQLLDAWFQKSDGVVGILSEQCRQGQLEVLPKMEQIQEIGGKIVGLLKTERDEELQAWTKAMLECLKIGVTWQANVVTTGKNFRSDISIGAEILLPPTYIGTPGADVPFVAELEVEYVEGFWHDTCVPKSGSLEIGVGMDYEVPNLGTTPTVLIGPFTVKVKVLEPVYIDCSQTGYTMPADAQAPFHGKALTMLNKDRKDGDGNWVYELEYDPFGGIIAQFEDGPKNLPFPDGTGEYDLWQLVTVYQATL